MIPGPGPGQVGTKRSSVNGILGNEIAQGKKQVKEKARKKINEIRNVVS